jgi:hypothetical protein
MIPVDMQSDNDCYAACIASITGVPIEKIPNVAHTGNEWFTVVAKRMWHKGWVMLLVPFEEIKFHTWLRDCYCVATGTTSRGERHAVVSLIDFSVEKHTDTHDRFDYDLRLAHDPHPSRSGIKDIIDITLLFPRNDNIVVGAFQPDDRLERMHKITKDAMELASMCADYDYSCDISGSIEDWQAEIDAILKGGE